MRFVKVPTGMGSGHGNLGARLAPAGIFGALPRDLQKKSTEARIVPFDLERTNMNIRAMAQKLFHRGDFCFFIGGDHSITRPLFTAFASAHRKGNPALVVFDAHADIGDKMHRLSHAAYLRTLAEEGIVGGNALVVGTQFGLKNELAFAKRKKIALVGLDEIKQSPAEGAERLVRFARRFDSIYLSIDLDVFSSVDAPAVWTAFGEGLHRDEFFPLYRALLRCGKVRAVDITEADFLKGGTAGTAALCSEIAKEAGAIAHHAGD